ncbi:anthrone oxygenase family protein [Tsukamurella sp. PLM1]|uniref:anthrone oxygenase family protein n=1 Tax=Tsukamurella sp. PLM1 TaxID=2929795 RepID=UPI00204A0FB0|nr:anthrone oxygenase family protein [Tsukamurella sp. PLM1]BDH56858.1 hypothetical protein MTP03_17970 [Tsukamurella sp. PLM1]
MTGYPVTPEDLGVTPIRRLTLAAALAAAVGTGVFYSWSAMVMPAIERLPTETGVATMKELNAAAPAPYSVVALITTGLCVIAVVGVLRNPARCADRVVVIAGAAAYFVAAIVVTFTLNVPLSYSIDQLAETDHAGWVGLCRNWMWANHVRTFGCAAATALLALGALRSRR